MDQELTEVEAELLRLTPAALPEGFLFRLDVAMMSEAVKVSEPAEEVIVPTCDPELTDLEEGLRGLAPFGMPDDLIARLDQAMQRWHEDVPIEEKIIPMHPASEAKSHWFGLRSVAAVAVLGAAVALIPGTLKKSDSAVADSPRIPVTTVDAIAPASFVSRDAHSSVVSANDHGVIWTKNGKALRCLEVEVKDSLEFVNDDGDHLFIEKPKHEVRFVPLNFD